MTGEADITPAEKLHQAFFEKSFKRLKRRSLTDEDAERIAKVVARKAVERVQVPGQGSEEALAAIVDQVCRGLAEGRSLYGLVGERPYLATGRIDRLVAVAPHVKPPVDAGVALTAGRATKLEKLSGAMAVLFMAVALTTIGPWYAVAVGVVVAIATEVYVQLGMPASVRAAAAQLRVPRYLGVAALLALAYLGYEWLQDTSHAYLYGAAIAVAALVVAFVLPGLTLAVMIGRRERRWRRGLEKRLVEVLRKGEEPTPASEKRPRGR
jgi:hypothetical protein